jgi:succinoglycan biosynthesis transport protein ExoP
LHRDQPLEHGSIRQFMAALRRRLPLVLVCLVITPAAAYAFSASRQKQYSASASLLFRDPGFDQKVFGSTALPPSTDPTREAATNLKLVSLEAVADQTARKLGRLTGPEVRQEVQAQAEGESNVVAVTATDPSPRFAALLANTFASQYIAFRRDADQSKIREAQRLIRRQLQQAQAQAPTAAAQTGQTRQRDLLQQLDVLASLQTGNAELVQRADAPGSPSSPRTLLNTAVGALLGGVFAVGLALLLERLDRRVRDPNELEAIFDRPVLGAVGESRRLARSGGSVERLETGEREAFRMLRANLRYFNVDHHVGSVLVTSAAPGDGKTTVAWNLAATAAEGGRILLIEADLRKPSIAEGLGLAGAPGLSTVLAGQARIEDVEQEISLQTQNGRTMQSMRVLLAGPLPPNPSDLLDSDRMRDLITNAERDYDLVVIDTPPTSLVSDAIPLIKQAGGVIVVGRIGKTTRDAAKHLKSQLTNLNAPVLGIVVNALRAGAETYGYGYSYSEEYPREGSRQESVLSSD